MLPERELVVGGGVEVVLGDRLHRRASNLDKTRSCSLPGFAYVPHFNLISTVYSFSNELLLIDAATFDDLDIKLERNVNKRTLIQSNSS